MARVKDLLLLVRAPLAATAVADVIAGAVLARAGGPGLAPRTIALAGAASCALYWAGMALNDLFDRERDRTLAPQRPIPSGRVSVGLAATLGVGLLALGIVLGALVAGTRGALGAGAVALAVLAYDALLKRSRVPGAAGMALCRGANVLFGAAVASDASLVEIGPAQLHAAVIAGYVFSLTLLSTYEDEDAGPPALAIGFGGALAVILVYGVRLPSAWAWIALAPLVLVVATRAGEAIRHGTKRTGKPTTRWLIRGILLADAAGLLGAGEWRWALVVVGLAVPYLGGAKLLMGPPPPRPATSLRVNAA